WADGSPILRATSRRFVTGRGETPKVMLVTASCRRMRH
ncbi:MAG: hypothetical protein AVDCRST_MAG02-3799, partial [uncultured Rubrobacteraceae bacterium]